MIILLCFYGKLLSRFQVVLFYLLICGVWLRVAFWLGIWKYPGASNWGGDPYESGEQGAYMVPPLKNARILNREPLDENPCDWGMWL